MVEKVEPALGQGRATILYEYPISEAALARPSAAEPRVAERFELYCCGVELANAFGELTDPAEQRRRFAAEMDEKERVYGERYPIDEDFLDALAIMPEASGVALGFDRLVMLATGARRIERRDLDAGGLKNWLSTLGRPLLAAPRDAARVLLLPQIASDSPFLLGMRSLLARPERGDGRGWGSDRLPCLLIAAFPIVQATADQYRGASGFSKAGGKSRMIRMTNTLDAAKLTDRVAALVEAAKRAGADAADAVAVRGRSAGVSVRCARPERGHAEQLRDRAPGGRAGQARHPHHGNRECRSRRGRREPAADGPRQPGGNSGYQHQQRGRALGARPARNRQRS